MIFHKCNLLTSCTFRRGHYYKRTRRTMQGHIFITKEVGPCHVCKNSHHCRHCAKQGGKCGVCKDELRGNELRSESMNVFRIFVLVVSTAAESIASPTVATTRGSAIPTTRADITAIQRPTITTAITSRSQAGRT